jgi:hypothetical protein
MKAISKAMLVSALVAGAMMAQPQFGPPDPATMVQRRVERLTAVLGLSSSQVTQATTIFTNAETAVQPIQTQMQTYHTSLLTAIKGNQVATIGQVAAQIGTAEGQILDVQAKAEAAFYAILTSDQQTKVNAMPGILGGGRGFGGPRGPRMRRQQ